MEKVYAFWYGNENCVNPRLKPIVDRLFREIPGAQVVGGYVRGLVHEDKVAHDIDVVVPTSYGLMTAEIMLRRDFGCRVVADNFPPAEAWFPGPHTYTRFACPRGVTIDAVVKSEYEKTPVASSVHHVRLTENGLPPADVALLRKKEFTCFDLGSTPCAKLEREGWKRN
jgi:hypothetical protein